MQRFPIRTLVLWHDNLGSAAQKMGWVVAAFVGSEPIVLTPQFLSDFDVKFLDPHYTKRDKGGQDYFCALPNPTGKPYLIKPLFNRMLPMPAAKQMIEPITVLDDKQGQRITVRSNGSPSDTLVTVGDTTLGRLTKLEVIMDASGEPLKVKLEGVLPDLSIVGRIVTVEKYDPANPG